jgi:Holliday junction resolvase RusA-like endonuclease
MNSIQFTVYGAPVAQPRQRHRVIQAHGRVFAQNYTPKHDPANQWKTDVKHEALKVAPAAPWEGPIHLTLLMYLPRPQTLYRKRDPEGRVWK